MNDKEQHRHNETHREHDHGHEDEHGHGHAHSHAPADASDGRLALSLLLNLGITLAEVAGGLLSNSLALLSDAVHNSGRQTERKFSSKRTLRSPKRRGTKRTGCCRTFRNISGNTSASLM
ncbi:hypothetical protein SDC9_184222 [bioreactor metagenome]|uniref:Cation efflux protein transmembrane domain-containing protein n=1 Tax=bioreactor metagenome TaxID=1076179 RepID=A0A645HEC3_9ZZZZ